MSCELNKETEMFDAEYVNIFGVPFTFLPHESDENVAPKPTSLPPWWGKVRIGVTRNAMSSLRTTVIFATSFEAASFEIVS